MQIAGTILAYHYHPAHSIKEASMLSTSLDQCTDRFKFMLRWVFEYPPFDTSKTTNPLEEHFQIPIPEELAKFPLGKKVFLAAEAESLAEQAHAPQLIWMDADNLILQEPLDLILTEQKQVAISPVHITNISSPADGPISPFWQLVYEFCHVPERNIFSVPTIANHQKIRAHFNAGLISVKPGAGLLRKWRQNFMRAVQDSCFDMFYEENETYKIYMHQAILVGTILAQLNRDQICLLPPTYNFPLHLLDKMDEKDRPKRMNDLVTARYEDVSEQDWAALPVDEPVKSWLNAAVEKLKK